MPSVFRGPAVTSPASGRFWITALPATRRNQNMPTLNWIGKEAVVNHHLQVPFHLLKDVPDLAWGAAANRAGCREAISPLI
jgi:hypothetical protein